MGAAEAEAAVAPPATLEEALLRVQGTVGGLALRRTGEGEVRGQGKSGREFAYSYKYLPYNELLQHVRPVLTANLLVWQTFPTTLEGKPALTYRMTFAPDGRMVEGTMLLMLDKATSQAQGSGLTYARRQALTAVLEITPDDDDDGAKASQPERPAPADPEASLSQDALDRLAEAIDELGVDRAELLAAAGVKPDATLTVADGRRVSERLQRIRAQREAVPS